MASHRWIWLVVIGAPAFLPGLVADAHAASTSPVRSGWWSSAAIQGAALSPPDVPSDGLLVQGGPTDPTAFSALAFSVPANTTPSFVTLRVAPLSLTLPSASMKACPLTTDFVSTQGGDASAGPSYDCTTFVVGAVSADGTSVTLDASTLPYTDVLKLALVPATSADRIVLQGPSAAFLELGAAAPSPTSEPTTDPASQAAASPVEGTGPGPAVAAGPVAPGFVPAGPTPGVAPAESPVVAEVPATIVAAAQPIALAPRRSSDGVPLGWLAVGLALLVSVLWRAAGSPQALTESALDDSRDL